MKLGPGEKTILLLAGFVVVVAGLNFAAPLLVPLCLAVVITAVSAPIIRWLEKRRVPSMIAILLAVLLDLSVVAGMVSLIGSSLSDFYRALPRYQVRLVALLREDITWLNEHNIPLSKDLNEHVSSAGNLLGLVGGLLSSIMNVVTTSLLVLLLAGFLLFEIGRWRLKIRYAMGNPNGDLRKFATAARELQKYLFVKTGMSLLTGVLCGSWAAILGLDFPILWGLIAFLLNYIPSIGSILAGIPPFVLALVQFGPGSAVGVAAGYVVVNFVLGMVEPRLMGRALGLSPLVVLASMVFWWWLWGPIGALLSAPLTMGVKIALAQTNDLRWLAILLGSTRWVEEMHEEWSLVRPTLTARPGQFCIKATGGGAGGKDSILTSKPHESMPPPPGMFVAIPDAGPLPSIRADNTKTRSE